MSTEIRTLVNELRIVKASLTRLKNFFAESGTKASVGALKKRLEANAGLYENFNNIQTKIELIVMGTDQEAAHETVREQFESVYFNLMADIEEHLAASQPPQHREASASPQTTQGSSQPAIKLPVIQLPSFDGNYNGWLKFRDTFLSLIHNNESLSDIQKFHYLDSSLEGCAARIIQSLGISDANYKIAWETLNARFQDSTALLRHHVHALLDITPVRKHAASGLREFLDDAKNHLFALKSLGEPVDKWNTLIVPMLARKLDIVSVREWEKRITTPESINFRHFAEFLEERARYLDNVSIAAPAAAERVERRPPGAGSRWPNKVTAHVANTYARCPACTGNHALHKCSKFRELTLAEKRELVRTARRCYNCLEATHQVQDCTRQNCNRCDKRHHTLLHREDPNPVHTANIGITESPSRPSTTCVSNIASDQRDYTLLTTAVVYVRDSRGQKHECRALLDSGSQANFVTRDFCKKLGVIPTPVQATVAGLGQIPNSVKGRVAVKIFSRCNSFRTELSCLAIETITEDMPNVPINRKNIQIPSNIAMADPYFDTSKRVDLLIGAGLFWRLLCIGQHKTSAQLVWQKTQLGWVLGGNLTWPTVSESGVVRCNLVTNNELASKIEEFWKVESLETRKPDIDNCESHFAATTRRDKHGRYIVRIPFKDTVSRLGNSREQAERRLYSLEKRLSKQPSLRAEYVQFMEEYEKFGHMSRVPISEICGEMSYYLPHHAVIKETSTTTKVRVVFDGSAKTSSGLSLNDTQYVGPTVQNELFSILVRFRQHRYILSADIEKMYRQILIDSKDRRLQKILWRSSPTSPVTTFELNTVTYGTASAPFLATRVLRQVGLDCAQTYPIISKILINDFYVDDLLTGTQTITEAIRVRKELSAILAQAGFQLRKWATNCPSILRSEADTPTDKEFHTDKDPKTLGLLWSPADDRLRFSVTERMHKRVTKRTILSEIAQIFDPLGLIGPVIVRAKIIMQKLWQGQTGWDEAVSQELHTQWAEYRNELRQVTTLQIPRCVVGKRSVRVELHGFADASEKAYGACVYLRSQGTSDRWESRLVCAKSRVAPLKSISLPRLELCGTLLLSQLMNKVRLSLTLRINEVVYWSDSTIALAWIQGPSSRWKTFVANRVTEINDLTSGHQWHHVRSQDNPADLISRGTTPTLLAATDLWWSGPSWLTMNQKHWPQSVIEKIVNVSAAKLLCPRAL
ncbi:uncharacterized protein LOC122400525 [Colletes gigas]|uniref:uncharacterized protein LOC122400525 n=1 Tax=Colletes gigas TaxID=935657 RepID=UPI001C9A8D87|nr:uncharacterized protein LOC122400525 [Colletes gigas]